MALSVWLLVNILVVIALWICGNSCFHLCQHPISNLVLLQLQSWSWKYTVKRCKGKYSMTNTMSCFLNDRWKVDFAHLFFLEIGHFAAVSSSSSPPIPAGLQKKALDLANQFWSRLFQNRVLRNPKLSAGDVQKTSWKTHQKKNGKVHHKTIQKVGLENIPENEKGNSPEPWIILALSSIRKWRLLTRKILT